MIQDTICYKRETLLTGKEAIFAVKKGVEMSLLMFLILLGSGTEVAIDGTVLVEVTGFEDNSGQAVVVLLTEEELGFPPNPDGAALTYRANIESLAVHLEIPSVPEGRYVAMAYHDANENGQFDMEDEFVGISGELPQMESQGGSRPEFEDICFIHEGTVSSTSITVRKMEEPQGGPPGGGEGGGRGGSGGGPPR